jgi:CheY-like chemotaxis protein
MCWGGGATMPRITLTGSPETRLPPAEIASRRGRGCDFSTMKAFFTRFTPVLFIGLLLLIPVGQTLADEEQAGTVTRLKGAAFAMQDAIPRVLSVGAAIQRGDVISTSPGARLEMKMLDDAVMTLGEKTIFVVIDYNHGYLPVIAEDIESVFSLDTPLHAVIIDIFRPGIGGIEGIKLIREKHPDAKIIAMSGGFGPMDKEQALKAAKQAGADAVLAKPFLPEELLKVVDHCLE